MFYNVNAAPTFCYTGGKAFNPAQPTALLIHGVLGDHSVWAWQSRYLAHHGWNVLAVDLPGHGKSAGQAPESVEQAAQAMAALLDAAGVQRAALIGHSWGSLIALQAAALLGQRASHLVLVGTAYPMKVSPALIQAAQDDPEAALKMINLFSRSSLASPSGAGAWVYGAGMALGRRVLQGNRQANVLHRGFVACDRYSGGEDAMARITCPALFILGEKDQMTPPRAAQSLINAGRAHGKQVQLASLPVGHHQMSEAPQQTLQAMYQFLRKNGL